MAISEAALVRVRRRKKARRLFAKMPLFAYSLMVPETHDYSYDAFWDDLQLKSKPKEKRKKSPLTRYGRWSQIERLITQWEMTGDINLLLRAQALRKHIVEPYRLLVRYGSVEKEYYYNATTPYSVVERLATITRQYRNFDEYEAEVANITKYLSYGN